MSGLPNPGILLDVVNITIAGFTILLLPFLPNGPRRARAFLILAMAALLQYHAGCAFDKIDGFQAHPHLIRVGSTGFFLIGPAIYLYVRTLAFPEQALRPRDALHALPFLWELTRRLPFFLLPVELKWQVNLATMHRDVLLNRMGYLVVMLGYLVALVPLLRRHEQELRRTQSNLAGRHLTWAFSLMLIWCTIPALSLGTTPGLPLPLPARFILNHLYAWNTVVVVLAAFLGITHQSRHVEQHDWVVPPGSDAGAFEPRPEEDGAQDALILSRVQTFMAEARPYMDPGLSLAGLAGRLRMSPNALSRAINRRLGVNFFTFINRYRVEEAQRRLLESGTPNILEIGLSSGFASKSTFNATFRKFTGLTPRVFRERNSDPGS